MQPNETLIEQWQKACAEGSHFTADVVAILIAALIETQQELNTERALSFRDQIAGLEKQLAASDAALIESRANAAESNFEASKTLLAKIRGGLAATRKQLAEAQADNAAMHSAAHRLALEAECFYLDCKDMALVSKWDDPLQTAISDVQAIRWDGDTSALSAAIADAVEPYKRDAERLKALLKHELFVRWEIKKGVTRFRVCHDGEDVTGWHNSQRAAIDAALAAKEAP